MYGLLKQAILELPEQTSNVYQLVLLGCDNRDISEKLGLTEDSVKAHRKRGKKLLKERLQNLMAVNPIMFTLVDFL